MKVKGDILCPGCKMKTLIQFQKPPIIGWAMFQFDCGCCGSVVLAKVARARYHKGDAKKPPAGQVQVKIKLIRASQMLVDMLKEEEAFNKEPLSHEQNHIVETGKEAEGHGAGSGPDVAQTQPGQPNA